jgi:dTDP-glucose 4,6-dehydratase
LVQGDIGDAALVRSLFADYALDGVLHLAAESHVDRSIANPMDFVQTNVVGTVTLLNAALEAWGEKADPNRFRFYHVSTDEVYGSLGSEGLFHESTPYDPRSPYSASKAASDHFVRAYHHTYGLPVVLSNCSNNYGPRQYPEKLIPVVIRALAEGQPIPVYGAGANVRDWLYVGDHVRAMEAIFHRGRNGETYNVGGNNEWNNLDLVRTLCRVYDQLHDRTSGSGEAQISFVTDRKGHDLRYAIDASKITSELGWTPRMDFEQGLQETVRFYSQAFQTTP